MILPSFNGNNYIRACVESITSQTYDDYELIVSDDHSTDGSRDYLASLANRHVKFVTPPQSMSMAEHWEWALDHTTGDWVIYVGQDDGLQPYFFELADVLTEISRRKKLRAIMSERAYFYWPGCESTYGDACVSYSARPVFRVKRSKSAAKAALDGQKNYFNIPSMYTTALFSRELIVEAREKQGGKLFVTHPQDANLAAVACSLEMKYLYSSIPLGWVGSSPKSAGLAVAKATSSEQSELKNEYLSRTSRSALVYRSEIGSFSLSSTVLYFWGALLATDQLQRSGFRRWVGSPRRVCRTLAAALAELRANPEFLSDGLQQEWNKVIERNHFAAEEIEREYRHIVARSNRRSLVRKLEDRLIRVCVNLGLRFGPPQLGYSTTWTKAPDMTLARAAQQSLTIYQAIATRRTK